MTFFLKKNLLITSDSKFTAPSNTSRVPVYTWLANGHVLETNHARINQTLAREGSGYQSNATRIPVPPWDLEPNSYGRSLAPHECSSYKSPPPITRHAPPLCRVSITLLNPEEKPHPARRAPPFRAIRTTAGEPGGRPPIRTMEKVSAPRTRTSWGVSACGCAMPFSARTLFVTAPTRLGVEELSQIEVFDTIRRANSMRMLGQRFQGEFLGGTLHRFWATAA